MIPSLFVCVDGKNIIKKARPRRKTKKNDDKIEQE